MAKPGSPPQHPMQQQDQTPHSLLTEQLPGELLPSILQHLNSSSLLALFSTCHATRALVLGHAHRVQLRPHDCPEARLPVLGHLLQPQATAAGAAAAHADSTSRISTLELVLGEAPRLAQLLPHLPALHEGRVKALRLEVGHTGKGCG